MKKRRPLFGLWWSVREKKTVLSHFDSRDKERKSKAHRAEVASLCLPCVAVELGHFAWHATKGRRGKKLYKMMFGRSLGVGWRKILDWMLHDTRMRIATSGRILWLQYWIVGLHKRYEIYWLAEPLLVSRETFCSKELIAKGKKATEVCCTHVLLSQTNLC
jgi:hypothetical protein